MSYLSTIHRAQQAALQRFGLKVAVDVTEADEPLQLVDAYDHLGITHDSDGSDHDLWLTAQIPAAREYCERYLGRSIATKTMERASNRFPTVAVHTPPGACFELPFGPVQSIASVKYKVEQNVEDSSGATVLDSDGVAVTEVVELTLDAATYEIDTYVTPNRLVLAYGQTWPAALDTTNSVKVRYVAGYVAAPDSDENLLVLPKVARSAMLLMLGHLFENREAVGANTLMEVPLGVQSLLELMRDRERLGMA